MITYALLDIRRLLRNTGGTIFTVLMPAGFYLIFGATQSYTDAAVAHGNVKATIMVSMAVYGAVLAVTTWGSHAALEQQRGWGRQARPFPIFISLESLQSAAQQFDAEGAADCVSRQDGLSFALAPRTPAAVCVGVEYGAGMGLEPGWWLRCAGEHGHGCGRCARGAIQPE